MPDLVTHIAISHLIKRPFEFGKQALSSVSGVRPERERGKDSRRNERTG